MKIIIEINDPETLEEYADVHKDLIIDDFVNEPTAWIHLQGTRIECEK